jgi:hypothetical protein
LDLVVHGHLHSRIDIVEGSTRILANARGRFLGVKSAASARAQGQYEYPGDAFDFEPNLLVNLDNGLSTVVQTWVDALVGDLIEICEDVEALAPHAGHRNKVIRGSIQESIEARSSSFVERLEDLLLKASIAFDAKTFGAAQYFMMAESLRLPASQYGLRPNFNEPFIDDDKPVVQAQKVAAAMRHYVEMLSLVPDAPVRIQREMTKTVDKIIENLRSQGHRFVFETSVFDRPWRKIPSKLGTITLEDDEQEVFRVDGKIYEMIREEWPRSFYKIDVIQAEEKLTSKPSVSSEPATRKIPAFRRHEGEW